MVSDKAKKAIESMTTKEMSYEINRGHASRFQREKFAYLKTCYESQLAKKPEPAPEPPTNSANEKHDWHDMALGKIVIGVIIIILGAIAIWSMNHCLSIKL